MTYKREDCASPGAERGIRDWAENYSTMPALSDFWRTFRTQNPVMDIPFRTQTGVGMLPAVLSPENGVGFQPNFAQQNGKRKIAKYKYKQRRLRATVKNTTANGSPNYCDASETPVYLEAEQEVTRDNYKQFLIPYEDVRNYEEGFQKVLQDEIAANINAILEEVNGTLITLYEASRGAFLGGSTTAKSYQGFSNLATYTINHALEQGIYDDFRDLQYRGQKIMVGDKLANAYFRRLMYGAANTERGQINNEQLMRDFRFFDDTMLDSELATTNNIFAWMPGSFQLLEWFRNVGEFRMVKDTVVKDTIRLNIGGTTMGFDITMTENFCQDETSGLNVTIRKEWDVWSFPADIFAAGDPLNGTNGMLAFKITGA